MGDSSLKQTEMRDRSSAVSKRPAVYAGVCEPRSLGWAGSAQAAPHATRPRERTPVPRLTDLLAQARKSDPQLAADLEAEFRQLTRRRQFGLVFERHQPEAVELVLNMKNDVVRAGVHAAQDAEALYKAAPAC